MRKFQSNSGSAASGLGAGVALESQMIEMEGDDWSTVLRDAQLKKFKDGELVLKV
jgi:hypothetical protein